jgi:hypothetical protein
VRIAVRNTWQQIVMRSVEHERSKNPYAVEPAPVRGRGRRRIERHDDDDSED